MKLYLIKLFLCIIIVTDDIHAIAAHFRTLSASVNAENSFTEISPEIVNELRDFRYLIPNKTVDEIVAKHLIIDSDFRRAVKFLRSREFKQLLHCLQQIPEVIEILNFLHLNAAKESTHIIESSKIEVADAERVPLAAEVSPSTWTAYALLRPVNSNNKTVFTTTPKIGNAIETEFVLIEYGNDMRHHHFEDVGNNRQRYTRHKVLGQPRSLGTFTTFVDELLGHLPRARYTDLINEKRQRSALFAQFYDSVRSSKLRPMVDALLRSANMSNFVRTLSVNFIDVNNLVPIGFELISWGPAIV